MTVIQFQEVNRSTGDHFHKVLYKVKNMGSHYVITRVLYISLVI